jgi:hypothetical protein
VNSRTWQKAVKNIGFEGGLKKGFPFEALAVGNLYKNILI